MRFLIFFFQKIRSLRYYFWVSDFGENSVTMQQILIFSTKIIIFIYYCTLTYFLGVDFSIYLSAQFYISIPRRKLVFMSIKLVSMQQILIFSMQIMYLQGVSLKKIKVEEPYPKKIYSLRPNSNLLLYKAESYFNCYEVVSVFFFQFRPCNF